jgi:hypothetical protein
MADTRGAYLLYVGSDVAAETFTASWLAPGAGPGAPYTASK